MHDVHFMRTTLDLDPDVLRDAKQLDERRGTTAGKILSALARKALAPKTRATVRNGIRPLPRRQAGSPRPTLALVNRLRDKP